MIHICLIHYKYRVKGVVKEMNSYYHKMLLVGLLSASILTGEVNHINDSTDDQSNKITIEDKQNESDKTIEK